MLKEHARNTLETPSDPALILDIIQYITGPKAAVALAREGPSAALKLLIGPKAAVALARAGPSAHPNSSL